MSSWCNHSLHSADCLSVPQGTKVDELRALVRKHRANIMGDTVASSASSAFGAATSGAGNQYAKATDSASLASKEAFNGAVNTWSESRMKAYLDARGVVSLPFTPLALICDRMLTPPQPVPQASKKDELRALVRKHSHLAASGWSAWTFDDFSVENLKFVYRS